MLHFSKFLFCGFFQLNCSSLDLRKEKDERKLKNRKTINRNRLIVDSQNSKKLTIGTFRSIEIDRVSINRRFRSVETMFETEV